MPLVPDPKLLHLASPALGPWFKHDSTSTSTLPPTLPLPSGDLSVALTLAIGMEWRCPAGALRSYFVATDPRPIQLRQLRQENSMVAFSTDSFIVLLTLLPEVEERLWTLSQPIPSPDGTAAPPANTPARPRVRFFALEIPNNIRSISNVVKLRAADLPTDLDNDTKKATFLGLSTAGGISNADKPTSELLRPATSSAIAVKNRTGMLLSVRLWCFDYRGRPLDAGAVANWWAFMANYWENLWAHTETAEQRTAAVTAGKVVHIVSAHEGPLTAPLKDRLNLTGLTQISGSGTLYSIGAAPVIGLKAAASPDEAPIPRIAALPLGSYADPASATPFAGWLSPSWPSAITRDFLRVGFVDLEQQIVGLTRTDAVQADSRRRISPARNKVSSPILTSTDTISGQIMTGLTAGGTTTVMAPVMDKFWGQVTPPSNFGSDALPEKLQFAVFPLAGEGTTTGGIAVNQIIVLRFEAGALPANSWIRIWTLGLDTTTGLHFKQNGGAARADANGQAYVVLPIPDGTAAPTTGGAEPVHLSFDALLLTNIKSRLFTDQRYDRPAIRSGSKISLPVSPALPTSYSMWNCEQGAVMNRGTQQYASGQALLAVPSDPASNPFALVDLTSLAATDITDLTLTKAASAGDILITTAPAFTQTPNGDITTGSGPNGATLIHRARNALVGVTTMGQPIPSQERREVVAFDQTNATGVIGSTPARAAHHETGLPQLGFAGVPAGGEVHGVGVALAGSVTDQLIQLMLERKSNSLTSFVSQAGNPVTPVADAGDTTTWAAVLETTTHGMTGDSLVRAVLAAQPNFTAGQSWLALKAQIESATGTSLDPYINTATFDPNVLAAAVDRVILKTKNGVKQFAVAVIEAIKRAEDFIYIETPALDALSAEGGMIDLIEAIKTRWTDRSALRVLLCVPEKYLPGQPAKLEQIRKSGIAGALKKLLDQADDRVTLFSPLAGPERPLHMASTTVIIDDAIFFTGTTHLWRRGLTFDSALSVGLFDEKVTNGRPAAIRAARIQLLSTALGLPTGYLPEDPEDCLNAIKKLNQIGGLGRIKTGLYPPKADPTSVTDLSIWNPDGRPGIILNWLIFFAGLTGDAQTEFNNAIR